MPARPRLSGTPARPTPAAPAEAETMSPRDRRHARLAAARASGSRLAPGEAAEAEDRDGADELVPRAGPSSGVAQLRALDGGLRDGDAGADGDASSVVSSSSDDDGGSTSASASGSSSSASSASASDDDDADDAAASATDDEADFERLLAAARERAAAASVARGPLSASTLQDDLEAAFEREHAAEAPIPDLAVPRLPAQHLALRPDGSATAATSVLAVPAAAGPPELDDAPYERAPSKRECASPRKASASEAWATMPAPRADRAAEMRRDYQALALASSLDPKRFMKGGSRAGKVPERFAIGTVVDAPRELQDTTLARARGYRPGQIVEGLARDAGVGAYAKRKYEDLQGARMRNGRGQGWRKRSKW